MINDQKEMINEFEDIEIIQRKNNCKKKKKITDSWREATKYPANIQFPGDELKSDNNDAEEKNYKYFSKI